jgi:predicted phosphodiesterase
MFNYWTPEEEELLTHMLGQHISQEDIAIEFAACNDPALPGFGTLRSLAAIRRKVLRIRRPVVGTIQTAPTPIIRIEDLNLDDEDEYLEDEVPTIDKLWESMKTIQTRYNEDSKFSTIGVAVNPPATKILVLSDIHFPFARLDYLQEALNTHSNADICVLNGDIIDGYIFSTFDKDKSVAALDEYNTAFEFVRLCSETFPKVVLVSGNHDVRSQKALARSTIPHAGHGVFQPDLLARIANGERLDRSGMVVEKVPMPNVYYSPTEQWWVQIGKTLFIHPHSRGSSKPGYTVSTWAHKFQERLPAGSFDAVVCGHTHAQSKHIQGNLLLIEQGCLCDYMSYSWQPRQIFHSSAISGYAVIYQDEFGNTDFNKSNYVYLGQLLPVDKPLITGS